MSQHHAMMTLTHGLSSLLVVYALVTVALFVGMVRSQATVPKLLLTPLLAVPMFVVALIMLVFLISLLHAIGGSRGGWVDWSFTVLVCVWLGHGAGRGQAHDVVPRKVYRRGAIVASRRSSVGRRLGSGRDAITLAGNALTLEDETKHFKFIGTTGTGKSTAIREILSDALARGDRVVIADPDGGYLANFYDAARGDVILNPFDPDSAKWNLLGEVTTDYDVDQLARSLIPDSSHADKIWSEYARTFFAAVMQQAMVGGIKDDAEIFRLLTKAPTSELKLLLAGTVAGPFLEDANERMFGSVRSVTVSALRALQYTSRQKAVPFSVRQWIRQGASRERGGQGGVLFLPYNAAEIAALRSTIAAWMRIAIFEAMSRPEEDQRLWFVVDGTGRAGRDRWTQGCVGAPA